VDFFFNAGTSVNFHHICSSHVPEDDSLCRYRKILSSRIDLADLCRFSCSSICGSRVTELCSVKMSTWITTMWRPVYPVPILATLFVCQIQIWFSPAEFKSFCCKLPSETYVCWEVTVHLWRWSTALIEIKLQSFGDYVPQMLSKWSHVSKCHLNYTKSEMEPSSWISGIKFQLEILLQLEVTGRWSVGRPLEPCGWSVFTPAAFVSLSLLASSRNEYNSLFWIPNAFLKSWLNRRDHLVSSYISCLFPRITSLKR
jgi:hypothetical protein